MAAVLLGAGVAAAPYHAGLPRATLEGVYTDFMGGAVQVVCATIAFGMGETPMDCVLRILLIDCIITV